MATGSGFQAAAAAHENGIDVFPDSGQSFSTTVGINEPTRFSTVDPACIAKLVKTKDWRWLSNRGGTQGLASALETTTENGIHGDQYDVATRRKAFGSNFCCSADHPRQNLVPKLALHALLESVADPLVALLFFCALLSLCFGIRKDHEAAALAAILAVVVVSLGGNFWPVYQCWKISKLISYLPEVDVVRDGKWHRISACRVVVGDVVFLKPGDEIPADGLFIEGSSLQVEITKPGGQVVEVVEADAAHNNNQFLCGGGRVMDGYARMLVTAVGKSQCDHHKIRLRGALVEEMARITSGIGMVGKRVAVVISLVLLGRFVGGNLQGEDRIVEALGFFDALAGMVGILASPAMIALTSRSEGLVASVKMGYAYSAKKLMAARVWTREPSVCNVVASVTTICINKTGTLTKSGMEVAKFWQGLNSIEEGPHNSISPSVVELLHQGIAFDTTQPPSRASLSSPANQTEKAIFDCAITHLKMDVNTLKTSCTVLVIEPFNPINKRSGVLISKNADNTFHVHRKGAPEVILPMCSHYYESTGIAKPINRSFRELLEHIVQSMEENGLRCIAFAHRKTSFKEYFTFSTQKLILLSLVGLRNPVRKWTRTTMEACRDAGVQFKILTGDNATTASIMASECGLLETEHQHGEVVEGIEFRNFTAEERMKKLDTIKVLARATPDDKLLMVQCLKQKGHVVAFMGRGIGNSMALLAAHVSLCFGTHGAEIGKAHSDIVLSHRNFYLIIKLLEWGRGMPDSIQAYTQFLITATVVALIVDSVAAVCTGPPPTEVSNGNGPYPVFQLLWVKLIVGFLSALAIIIKPPARSLMHKPPTPHKQPILTPVVQTNICIQALYQVIMLLFVYFKGELLLHMSSDQRDAVILNTYVLSQVIAILDACISGEDNVLEEIQRNKLLWGVVGLIIFIQVLMIEVLKKFTSTDELSWGQWGTCIALAASCWLISGLLRMFRALKNTVVWPRLKPKVD